MSTPDLRVLSYGGGTQSAALALMSAEGQLPKLDAVVFADTHGELPETYEYADYVAAVLEQAGIRFLRVSAGSLEDALLANGPSTANPMPPAHVLNPDGTKGKVARYKCSYEYKRREVTRHIKKLVGGPGAWKHATVEQWLGFSVDELGRCKPDRECRCGHNRVRPDRKTGEARGHIPGCTDCACVGFDPWRVNVFPLIKGFGLQYRRQDTINWFGRNGHPTPPRSACWFCPNSRNARWADLKLKHPDLWERACRIDEGIRHGGGFTTGPMAGAMFLHDSRIPLRTADLRTPAELLMDDGQDELFDGAALAADCESGVCFT